MKKVAFTETVLRGANQSLIATRLSFDKFEKILPTMDKAGYYSVECWGGATFDACLRFLKEDPWERLRKIRAAMPNSKLQMLFRGQNMLGYKHYPDDVVRKFIQKSVENRKTRRCRKRRNQLHHQSRSYVEELRRRGGRNEKNGSHHHLR